MRRILVPLDGTPLGEAILADACDLAGHHGELVLLHVVPSPSTNRGTGAFAGRDAVTGSEEYLESVAEPLRARGFMVRKRTEVRANLSAAIDEAAVVCDADMVAIATHGRGPGGRILHGGVAWKALAIAAFPFFCDTWRSTKAAASGHSSSRSWFHSTGLSTRKGSADRPATLAEVECAALDCTRDREATG